VGTGKKASSAVPRLPRIIVSAGCGGYLRAGFKADVIRVLTTLGPLSYYGIRSIELHPQPAAVAAANLRLGKLMVPGRIMVYDPPASPWIVPGVLAAKQQEQLRKAGAVVEEITSGLQTRIIWPGTTLRDFMLLEVLLHEIGHHFIQHHKGKRTARVARTRDHEAFASYFARCYRPLCRSCLYPDE